jgi:hypothetical protein
MMFFMGFVKRIQPDREGRPVDWMVAQIRGKFLAIKCDFSEQYDPEKVCYGNPTMRMFRYRFTKERAEYLVYKINRKSPLTLVATVDGKICPVLIKEGILPGLSAHEDETD